MPCRVISKKADLKAREANQHKNFSLSRASSFPVIQEYFSTKFLSLLNILSFFAVKVNVQSLYEFWAFLTFLVYYISNTAFRCPFILEKEK